MVEIPRGVAVVAESTWAAIKGKQALQIEWDESGAETRGSQELLEHYRAALEQGEATITRHDCEADQALTNAATIVEAQFEFPYLAHAALEPLNAVARMQDGVLEVWGGHQMPTLYQRAIARLAFPAAAASTILVRSTERRSVLLERTQLSSVVRSTAVSTIGVASCIATPIH